MCHNGSVRERRPRWHGRIRHGGEHLRGKRILLVDDERELADMVATILHGAGFACVDVVHAGAEALAAIDSAQRPRPSTRTSCSCST